MEKDRARGVAELAVPALVPPRACLFCGPGDELGRTLGKRCHRAVPLPVVPPAPGPSRWEPSQAGREGVAGLGLGNQVKTSCICLRNRADASQRRKACLACKRKEKPGLVGEWRKDKPEPG